MPIFVIFVFASIVFGAGAMLAPALPTHGPRIGLAAGLTLSVLVSGALFWTALFGWDTLVIDYMWFALLVGIFFGGTMSAGMFRAEAKGEEHQYSGWPGPRELAFFLMVAIIFAAPALTLPVPLDTDAQGFGYLALTLRDGGNLTTLAPFHPDISYLYSPGFPALVAYLGRQLNAGLHNIQLAIGGVLSVLFVWIAYDFGNELDSDRKVRRTGIAMAISALIGTGLLTANLDSHYTTLLGLVFALAFLTFAIRFHREGRRADFLAAALTLAGVPLAQPDATIILILGYVPWLATMWLAKPRPTFQRWLGVAAGIPLLALAGISPWLAKIAPMLGSNIQSPFEISSSHLLVMVVYHGGVIVLLSLIGIGVAARRRSAVDLLMVVWLVLVVDFSSVGLLPQLLPWLPISKYDYPFSIAWHGPIIPYLYFGGTALIWLVDRIGRERAEHWIKMASLPLMNILALIVVLVMLYTEPLLAASKNTPLQIFGTFSSRADVQAMQWLQRNAPPDALILNHPGPHEADWAPVIAQRNTVYFRDQPFFQNTEKVKIMQDALLAFWNDPANTANADLLARYGVDYVLVPQIVTRPNSIRAMFRWRPPIPGATIYKAVGDVPYLKLVHDVDGAQVYQVIPTVASR